VDINDSAQSAWRSSSSRLASAPKFMSLSNASTLAKLFARRSYKTNKQRSNNKQKRFQCLRAPSKEESAKKNIEYNLKPAFRLRFDSFRFLPIFEPFLCPPPEISPLRGALVLGSTQKVFLASLPLPAILHSSILIKAKKKVKQKRRKYEFISTPGGLHEKNWFQTLSHRLLFSIS
jgi:hypothetical protein